MKKIISLLCTLVLAMSLMGCDSEEEDKPLSNAQEYSSEETAKALAKNDAVRLPQVKLKGNGEDTVTILVYMNGSNLESDDGSATEDLTEMVKAGSSDKVNVIVQTMGTKKWKKTYGISNKHSQRYEVSGNGLTLVDDSLKQLDCTDPATLTDFIKWGAKNYPADRYELIFWDHGGGPVYSFGYDEWNSDENATLSLDEIQSGVKNAGVYFDFIGMDACIMSCVEVCAAMYSYCDYMILSEDFESGIGWYYTPWLKALYKNSSIKTPELGKIIVDEMIDQNETSSDGDDGILAVVDEGMIKVLFAAWTNFAYNNIDALLKANYSQEIQSRGKTRKDWTSFFDFEDDEASLSEYHITDLMAVASTIDCEETDLLASALNNSLVYVKTTSGDATMTGLSVTLPYGDSSFYKSLKTILLNCGFDNEYITWLKQFTDSKYNDSSSYEDYSDWNENWNGWEEYDDEYDWEDDYDYDDYFSIFDYLFGFVDDDDYWEDYDNFWYEDEEYEDEDWYGHMDDEDDEYWDDEDESFLDWLFE